MNVALWLLIYAVKFLWLLISLHWKYTLQKIKLSDLNTPQQTSLLGNKDPWLSLIVPPHPTSITGDFKSKLWTQKIIYLHVKEVFIK